MSARGNEVAARLEEADRPSDLIFFTLPRRLACYPHLEVFDAVIQTVAVLVMNLLPTMKSATERLFHHFAVLKDFSSADIQQPVPVLIDIARASSSIAARDSGTGVGAVLAPEDVRLLEPVRLAAQQTVVLYLSLATFARAVLHCPAATVKRLAAALADVALRFLRRAQPAHPSLSAVSRTADALRGLGWRAIELDGADRTRLLDVLLSHPSVDGAA